MPVKRKAAEREPIPETFTTLEEAGDFWDTHSLADYWDQTRPVRDIAFKFERRRFLIELESSLVKKLQKAAKKKGVSWSQLANELLSEQANSLTRKRKQ